MVRSIRHFSRRQTDALLPPHRRAERSLVRRTFLARRHAPGGPHRAKRCHCEEPVRTLVTWQSVSLASPSGGSGRRPIGATPRILASPFGGGVAADPPRGGCRKGSPSVRSTNAPSPPQGLASSTSRDNPFSPPLPYTQKTPSRRIAPMGGLFFLLLSSQALGVPSGLNRGSLPSTMMSSRS